MESIINHITARMHAVAEGSPWFGLSVKEALETIDHVQAVERINKQHNIAEILNHINQWKKFSFEKTAGDTGFDIVLNSNQDWKKIDHLTAREWQALRDMYFELNAELVDAIQHVKKDWLDQIVPDRKYSFADLFHGIIDHDIYHLGQIIIVHKMIKK
jgi:uncharacterized damage-inducible protein DinB